MIFIFWEVQFCLREAALASAFFYTRSGLSPLLKVWVHKKMVTSLEATIFSLTISFYSAASAPVQAVYKPASTPPIWAAGTVNTRPVKVNQST